MQVASLQEQLDELKGVMAAQQATAAPPANGVDANGVNANGVANGASVGGSAPPAANGAAADAAAGSTAEAAPPANAAAAAAAAAPSSFDEEARSLTQEIEAQLSGTAKRAGGRAAGGGGKRGSKSGRPALSRMRKADLIAECEERKLESSGSLAELRAALRVERKRDTLVAELEERGWSERQARSALGKAGWDLDAAIAKLTKG